MSRIDVFQYSLKILNSKDISFKTSFSIRSAMQRHRKEYKTRNFKFWNKVHLQVNEVIRYNIKINFIIENILGFVPISPNNLLAELYIYNRIIRDLKSNHMINQIEKDLIEAYKREYQDIPKFWFKLVAKSNNFKLKKAIKQQKSLKDRLSMEYSFPKWIISSLLDQRGLENTEKLLNDMQTPPMKHLWFNPFKGDPNVVSKDLISKKYIIKRTNLKNVSSLQFEPIPIQHNGSFNQGKALLIDRGSSIISQLLPLNRNDKVLDACASPGNKTIQILARETSIKLYAGDSSENRMKTLKNRLKFLIPEDLFTNSIELLDNWDARNPNFDGETFNGVFIDAPCSGSGTFGSRPDNKLILSKSKIEEYQKEQLDIITALAPLVKTDGHLLYATCSVLAEENEEVIKEFLEINSDFSLINVNAIQSVYPYIKPSKIMSKTGYILTDNSRSEAFFVALLKRKIR